MTMAGEKLLILDGGLGTLLFSRQVYNSGDPLWSARCLVSPPESEGRRQLRQAHLDFLAAGANIIKTNSYQMTPAHLRKWITGLSEENAMEIIRDSVRIARDACRDYWQSIGGEKSGEREPSVAGSIGPYGACQADMSEYTGAYADSMTEEDFIEWHRPRLVALLQAGVDYLAIETFPALVEAKAILKLLQQEAPDTPAWIAFSCKDEQNLCHGDPLITAFREIWMNKTPGLKAVGINCTPGKLVLPLLRSLNGLDIPVILYPNREEGNNNYPLSKFAKEWLAIHPNIFALGGCCDYHPADLNSLRNDLIERN